MAVVMAVVVVAAAAAAAAEVHVAAMLKLSQLL